VGERSKRLELIRRLVSEKRIGTQKELVNEIERQGFSVTQATVSRDIADLRLRKTRDEGGSIYILPQGSPLKETDHLRRMLKDFVSGIVATGNLIILKTQPGSAQGVASAIDNVRWVDILGTIAGDDTILVVSLNDRTAISVLAKLEDLKKE